MIPHVHYGLCFNTTVNLSPLPVDRRAVPGWLVAGHCTHPNLKFALGSMFRYGYTHMWGGLGASGQQRPEDVVAVGGLPAHAHAHYHDPRGVCPRRKVRCMHTPAPARSALARVCQPATSRSIACSVAAAARHCHRPSTRQPARVRSTRTLCPRSQYLDHRC